MINSRSTPIAQAQYGAGYGYVLTHSPTSRAGVARIRLRCAAIGQANTPRLPRYVLGALNTGHLRAYTRLSFFHQYTPPFPRKFDQIPFSH